MKKFLVFLSIVISATVFWVLFFLEDFKTIPKPVKYVQKFCVDVRFGPDECYPSYEKAREFAGLTRVYEIFLTE